MHSTPRRASQSYVIGNISEGAVEKLFDLVGVTWLFLMQATKRSWGAQSLLPIAAYLRLFGAY